MGLQQYFTEMSAHVDAGGKITATQREALEAWESGVRRPASHWRRAYAGSENWMSY